MMVDQNAPERDARYGGKVNIFVRYPSKNGTIYEGIEFGRPTNGEELYGCEQTWPTAVFSFSPTVHAKYKYLPLFAKLRVPLQEAYKSSKTGKDLRASDVVDSARSALYRRCERKASKAPTGQADGSVDMQWELLPLRAVESSPAEEPSVDEEMESLMQDSNVVELLENSDEDAEPSPTGEVAAVEVVQSADSSTIPGDAQGSSDAYQDDIGQEERITAETIAQTQEQNAAETTALMEEGTDRLRRVADNAAKLLADGLLLLALRSPRAKALEACDWFYKEEPFLKKVEKQWGAKLTEEQKKLCHPIFTNADMKLRKDIPRIRAPNEGGSRAI